MAEYARFLWDFVLIQEGPSWSLASHSVALDFFFFFLLLSGSFCAGLMAN